jgi:hypothetical protein
MGENKRARLTSMFWWVLVVCFLTGWQVCSGGSARTNSASFFEVLTNCPSIEDLVLEVEYYAPEPTAIQFRYRPGGLYARQLSDAEPSLLFPPTRKGTACGYWGDEFWFLQPGISNHLNPVLWTGKSPRPIKLDFASDMFERVFSLFASFGISDQGVGSVSIQSNAVVTVAHHDYSGGTFTSSASLDVKNGIPLRGWLQPNITGNRKPEAFRLSYKYNPATVPLPFPTEITRSIRVPENADAAHASIGVGGQEKVVLRIAVKSLTLARRDSPIASSLFTMNLESLGSNYQHLVVVNGEVFEKKANKLQPFKQGQ